MGILLPSLHCVLEQMYIPFINVVAVLTFNTIISILYVF